MFSLHHSLRDLGDNCRCIRQAFSAPPKWLKQQVKHCSARLPGRDVEADITDYERFQVVHFSLRFALEIHRHFARPTIVLIAVGELLTAHCERSGAFLPRICLSISVVPWIFSCVLSSFRVLLLSGICLPPLEVDSRNIEPSITAS